MSKRLKGSVDDVDDNEEEEEEEEEYRKKKKRRLVFGESEFTYKSAKKLAFSPFNKLHKFYKKHTTRSNSSPISKTMTKSSHSQFFNTSPIVNNSSSGGVGKRSGKYFGCLCMSKNQTLDTNVDEIDPCEPGVDYGSLKTLIETNDFYSKECNTHFAD